MMVPELMLICQTARLEVLEKEMTKANEEYARAVERASEFFPSIPWIALANSEYRTSTCTNNRYAQRHAQ